MNKRILGLVLTAAIVIGIIIAYPMWHTPVSGYDDGSMGPRTMEELEEFLMNTEIPLREYRPFFYDCKHFATDLWKEATDNGFEAKIVIVNLKGGHMLMAFSIIGDENTTQTILVEPGATANFIKEWHDYDIIMILGEGDCQQFYQAVKKYNALPPDVFVAIWRHKIARYIGRMWS